MTFLINRFEHEHLLRKQRRDELGQRILEILSMKVFSPNGSGGFSTPGNCARRAFNNPEKFAECLGNLVEAEFIEDFYSLLQTLNCGFEVEPAWYQNSADEWLNWFHRDDELNWNWPAQTVHKETGNNYFLH